MDSNSSAMETESEECGFVLPFTLQDLCLLEVINDLNYYPDDLLASLPHWLRYRLLHNLPAIDLCRLARTRVAVGIDVAEIWKPRTINPKFYCDTTRWDRNLCNPFQVGYCFDEDKNSGFILKPVDIPNLDPELLALFKAIPKGIIPDVGISPGCAVIVHDLLRDPDSSGDISLTNAAMSILNSIDPVLDEWSRLDPKRYRSITDHLQIISDHLLSMRGDLVMGNMTGIRAAADKPIGEQGEFQEKYQQWNLQATMLAKHQDKQGVIYHTPLRYLPIRDRANPLELFTLITQDCGLRPTNIMIDYSKLFVYVKKRKMDKEKLAEALRKSMGDVVHLGLWRQDAGCEPTMSQTVVEGVVGDGTNCKLKVLYCRKLNEEEAISVTLDPYLCTLPSNPDPPRYTGLRAVEFTGLDFGAMPYVTAILQQHKQLKVVNIDQVQTWATIMIPSKDIDPTIQELFHTCGELFHRPIFQVLKFRIHHTMIKTGNPYMMKDLMRGFMSAPCNHEQQLALDHNVEYKYRIRDLREEDLASFEYDKGRSVPDCAVRHKRLITKTPHVQLLFLRLPIIRMKEVIINCGIGRQVHLTALHPNLCVDNLILILESDVKKTPIPASDTIVEDMKLLLKKPTLKEVSARGHWGAHDVSMQALAEGFKAQAEVNTLRKIVICICSYTIKPHNKDNLIRMWESLCALPRLDDVEITVYADEYLEIAKSIESMIHENWQKYAQPEGRKIKVLEYLTVSKRPFPELEKVAHSFVQKRPHGFVTY